MVAEIHTGCLTGTASSVYYLALQICEISSWMLSFRGQADTCEIQLLLPLSYTCPLRFSVTVIGTHNMETYFNCLISVFIIIKHERPVLP